MPQVETAPRVRYRVGVTNPSEGPGPDRAVARSERRVVGMLWDGLANSWPNGSAYNTQTNGPAVVEASGPLRQKLGYIQTQA